MENEIAQKLIDWFRQFGRDFPWRKTTNPFNVLIAEKLLQQTSVREGVIAAYLFITETYPSPQALAGADLEALNVQIQPLGLHYRAAELIRMSRELVENYGGKVPDIQKDLLSIYGIGHYSARAVLSFAFNQDVAVVDTNVARILYRVFDISERFPLNPARSAKLTDLAQSLLSPGKSKEFNWAMIDLGALICLPRQPRCNECPINSYCLYFMKSLLENQRA
jgi:A/G-specific adenine glycosylase